MLKKKIFAVVMYVLACFTVLSACVSTAKEETEQSSEKKAKKKDKKKKDKKKETEEDSKEGEKETAQTLADLESMDERERLKAQLVMELDDFLSSDFTSIATYSENSDKSYKYSIFSSRIKDEEEILYTSVIEDSKNNYSVNLMTDGKVGYVSYGDTPGWDRVEDKEALISGRMTDASYISYISFVYAALDAGLDCPYASEYSAYYITTNEETAGKLDLKAIKSKLNNADKFSEYEQYLVLNEQYLKAYDKGLGVVRKSFLFELKDNEISFTEILNDAENKDLYHSVTKRIKSSDDEENRVNTIEKFNKIKSTDPNN